MKIAAAQIRPIANDTDANIEKQLKLIDDAIAQQVQLIAFPEMSLTGYERELAAQLAFSENDERLGVFKDKAQSNNIVIIVGAPLKINTALHIGAFIFLPDGTTSVYTKQFLHNGEEKYFTPNSKCNPLIAFQNKKVSFAICSDINNPTHPAHAAGRNSSLYIASIFYTPRGIADGYQKLQSYAMKYGMDILMANFTGSSYGMEAAGQSAFWNKDGILVAKLNDAEEDLLMVEM